MYFLYSVLFCTIFFRKIFMFSSRTTKCVKTPVFPKHGHFRCHSALPPTILVFWVWLRPFRQFKHGLWHWLVKCPLRHWEHYGSSKNYWRREWISCLHWSIHCCLTCPRVSGGHPPQYSTHERLIIIWNSC